MNKERIVQCEDALRRSKEFIALDILEQLKRENRIIEDILIGEQIETDRLKKENEQLKQELLTYKNAICNKECAEVWGESERAKILLKATLDLLQKQKESHYVLNLLENTVFYDEAECDGYCLFDDIEMFLTNGS